MMKQYDFTPLMDFITNDTSLEILSNSLSQIYMRFTEMRLDHVETISTDDSDILYDLRRVIEAVNDMKKLIK